MAFRRNQRTREIKHEIRVAAEAEEKEFYEHRAPAEWLKALAPIGTDWRKPFLENSSVADRNFLSAVSHSA